MQDGFGTEKRKSSITDRKGSLRFYDDIQSANFSEKDRDETSSAVQQNASMYKNNEFNPTQAEQQEPFYDTQIDYRGQSQNVYESEQYNDSQYNDQQNYDGIQYRTEVQQPTSEYEYQPGYQEYDTQQQMYQSNNLPVEPEKQYETDIRATKPTHDVRSVQQYQNFSESGTSNMGQRPNMPKQSATKKNS